ncbi:hypothetical protein KW782_05005 [Candidatus Parcubacteria bacterium]|nr:hypothetical protein [Candidatus Parcubacteria bacterium]
MKSKAKKSEEIDVELIQRKIDLIERGLPVDITESELASLETTFRGARSFYIDMIKALYDRRATGEDVEHHIIEESKNLAGVELALRKIDEFRKIHSEHIKTK